MTRPVHNTRTPAKGTGPALLLQTWSDHRAWAVRTLEQPGSPCANTGPPPGRFPRQAFRLHSGRAARTCLSPEGSSRPPQPSHGDQLRLSGGGTRKPKKEKQGVLGQEGPATPGALQRSHRTMPRLCQGADRRLAGARKRQGPTFTRMAGGRHRTVRSWVSERCHLLSVGVQTLLKKLSVYTVSM